MEASTLSTHQQESQSQLADKLAKAAQQITVGARYMHYKQLSYKVTAIALREEDGEPCVVYKAEYGDELIWTRLVSNWLEEVEVGGKKVRRFTKIDL
jgi:hypothetical protein